ncbi:hypothetical protein GCWU000341_01472 [Oribacterium sp. oral taxon 078 str. F0262]|nr:hypothetical protein GCWU000341_01472 [Oribacterium sp. oral taxon 078 str. F0262]
MPTGGRRRNRLRLPLKRAERPSVLMLNPKILKPAGARKEQEKCSPGPGGL